MDIIEINFDIIEDKNTGQRLIQIKSLPNNLPYKGMIFNCLLISSRIR